MAKDVRERPADSAETDVTTGGYAEIARRLTVLHPERNPFSRQLVYRWFMCRASNGFPAPVGYEVRGGRSVPLFDLGAVELWHSTEHKARPRQIGARPPIETIPLFDVDGRGHPVDAEQIGYRGHPQVREGYRSSVLDL